jgi:hypothetical protein
MQNNGGCGSSKRTAPHGACAVGCSSGESCVVGPVNPRMCVLDSGLVSGAASNHSRTTPSGACAARHEGPLRALRGCGANAHIPCGGAWRRCRTPHLHLLHPVLEVQDLRSTATGRVTRPRTLLCEEAMPCMPAAWHACCLSRAALCGAPEQERLCCHSMLPGPALRSSKPQRLPWSTEKGSSLRLTSVSLAFRCASFSDCNLAISASRSSSVFLNVRVSDSLRHTSA